MVLLRMGLGRIGGSGTVVARRGPGKSERATWERVDGEASTGRRKRRSMAHGLADRSSAAGNAMSNCCVLLLAREHTLPDYGEPRFCGNRFSRNVLANIVFR